MVTNNRGGKKAGGSTAGIECTTGYKRRIAEKKRKEEEYWQSMNGPVIITKKAMK